MATNKQTTGFKFGKYRLEVLERLGGFEYRGKKYRLLRVRTQGGIEYLSIRLYNTQGKFIKQFLFKPEIRSQIIDLLREVREKETRIIKLVTKQVTESYNTILRWHWTKRQKYNEDWFWLVRKAIGRNIQKIQKPLQKAKIDFYIYFPTKHRRDKANYAQGLKPILDYLCRIRLIVDDNWDRIDDSYHQRFDPRSPRTEIIIEEVK